MLLLKIDLLMSTFTQLSASIAKVTLHVLFVNVFVSIKSWFTEVADEVEIVLILIIEPRGK